MHSKSLRDFIEISGDRQNLAKDKKDRYKKRGNGENLGNKKLRKLNSKSNKGTKTQQN